MFVVERTLAQKIIDALFFPIRALLIHWNSRWGLTSLRHERMSMCRQHVEGLVLDIGCGPENVFIRHFIRDKGRGWGCDVYPYHGIDILVDSTTLPFKDGQFDTVTMIAVGGHIPINKRVATFRETNRVIKSGGRLIFTEGESVTQHLIHLYVRLCDALLSTELDIDGQRGMAKGESYCIVERELRSLFRCASFKLVKKHYFQWGLNRVYVVEKT